jgi:hypothetical protein
LAMTTAITVVWRNLRFVFTAPLSVDADQKTTPGTPKKTGPSRGPSLPRIFEE